MIKTPHLFIANESKASKTQLERLAPGDRVVLEMKNDKFYATIIFTRGSDHLAITGGVNFNNFDIAEGDLISLSTHHIHEVRPGASRKALDKFMLIPNGQETFLLHTHPPRFIARVMGGQNTSPSSTSLEMVMQIDYPENPAHLQKAIKDATKWAHYAPKQKP